jgi:hypothetical protein
MAARRRGRPPARDGERKDRLLQTRVDEDLEETLRAEAKRQRTTVSQLIRNVLQDTFQLVDNIVAETANLTDTVRRDARRLADSAKGLGQHVHDAARPRASAVPDAAGAAPAEVTGGAAAVSGPGASAGAAAHALAADPRFADVDAWQEVVVAKARPCDRCGRGLEKGHKGLMGLSGSEARPLPWICPSCLVALGG